MRLTVSPAEAGHEVRVDIENVTKQPITMKAGWWHDTNDGNFAEFIEGALSVETWPAIAPWIGQVMGEHRTKPQPEQLLAPSETWSTSWKADGKTLKSHVADPLSVHNPEFPFPGLYAVHGLLTIAIADEADGERTVKLRSNEQLVSVGGSKAAPKHTHCQLWGANEEDETASLSLGQLAQIEKGDEFEIVTGMGESWKLTIAEVYQESSRGKLELLRTNPEIRREARFPGRSDEAALIIEKLEAASN